MCQKSRSLSTQVVFCDVYGLAKYNHTFELSSFFYYVSFVFVIDKYYFKWKFRSLSGIGDASQNNYVVNSV